MLTAHEPSLACICRPCPEPDLALSRQHHHQPTLHAAPPIPTRRHCCRCVFHRTSLAFRRFRLKASTAILSGRTSRPCLDASLLARGPTSTSDTQQRATWQLSDPSRRVQHRRNRQSTPTSTSERVPRTAAQTLQAERPQRRHRPPACPTIAASTPPKRPMMSPRHRKKQLLRAGRNARGRRCHTMSRNY